MIAQVQTLLIPARVIALLLSFSAMVVHGADNAGMFWTGGGVGNVDCPEFVKVMDRANSHPTGSAQYVRETQPFVMYIAGFQTAYNMQTPNTCNIFNGVSTQQITAWAAAYCQKNPLEKFESSMSSLAKELWPRRLRVCQ